MRTKSLLIAVAALAATVVSSNAQVYSQNIVGYVNQTVGLGFVNSATPLTITGGNTLTNIFPNPGTPGVGGGPIDGTTVYVWNGSSYTIYTIDSYWNTGVGNFLDSAAVTPPTLNPGTLYFFNNNLGVAFTNTVVGQVQVGGPGGSTNVVGVTTNVLGAGFTFVSSVLPIAGGVSSVLQLTNPGGTVGVGGGALDGTLLYFPNISASGGFLGYNIITIDSYWSTGFGNFLDSAAVPEPTVKVGQGFIFDNNLGAPVNWIQSL